MMIGDKCQSCGVEWADHPYCGDHEYVSEEFMSGEWTSGDRLSIRQNLERIATVLEERLPPISESNDSEDLRRINAELADTNVRLNALCSELRIRADGDRDEAAKLVLERDRLAHRIEKLCKALNEEWCDCPDGLPPDAERCLVCAMKEALQP